MRSSLSDELRSAEKEIDGLYLENPLVKLPFDHAAWHLLAFCEEMLLMKPAYRATRGEASAPGGQAVLADSIINSAKWPIRWLETSCPAGRIRTYQIEEGTYDASKSLLELAGVYLGVESAFVYAGLGLLDLKLVGTDLIPSGAVVENEVYEVYDRLAAEDDKLMPYALDRLPQALEGRVRVVGQKFSYSLDRQLVNVALDELGTELSRRFRLPADWSLGGYTLGEHARVAKVLWALSVIHMRARLQAMNQGCFALGYSSAVCLWKKDKLAIRLADYSGVSRNVVNAVLEDMTHSKERIRSPDIAMQPLIPMTKEQVAWSPSLLVNSSMDRNLLVRMNRSADTREEYARLSQQNSELLRKRIERDLDGLDIRFWSGSVAGWPSSLDVDLALISASERHCLCLELKSFISPAEPREVRDRSEEIRKGIAQVVRRRGLAQTHQRALCDALKIEPSYTIGWAVVSETSIGGGWIQDPSVPVVRASHFVRVLRRIRSLEAISSWLEKREHLPIVDKHYRRNDLHAPIGRWNLKWFDIDYLVERLP